MVKPEPWANVDFNLDSSGVAGFFGGEEAISAMTTVHLYRGRRWLGWYNSPGGYTVAKWYGRLARASLWTGLYPGAKLDPVELFELGGKKSPRFVAAHSGTVLQETGHLGYLLTKQCEGLKAEEVGTRRTTPIGVTIVNLDEPDGLHSIDGEKPSYPPPPLHPAITDIGVLLASFVPIGFSLGASILCAVYEDYYSFAMILVGMIANGLTCLVLGSGVLTVNRVKSASDAPQGDGLLETKKEMTILLGPESAVAQVTRSSFTLQFPKRSVPNYHDVGVCCVLQTAQFLLQLLLIPQGGLFGQFMFLSSFAASWAYNAYLSSFDKEDMQRRVLLTDEVLKIDGEPKRYMFGTRTCMAVFVMFVLQPMDARNLLDYLIPNDTVVWNAFKSAVAKNARFDGEDFLINMDGHGAGGDKSLVQNMINDAQEAYKQYRKYCAFRDNEKRPTEKEQV